MEASRLHTVPTTENITIATPKEAKDFTEDGMQQLDRLLVGEERAKRALLIAMAMGRNIVAIGGTGVGKTELARHSWRLIEDISPEDVVNLDVKDDMQPKEVTGAVIPTRNQKDGKQEMIVVEGLLKPESKVLIGNEINRTSPSALNAILEVFENREMEVAGELVTLDDLIYAVATMNPGERREKVHKLSQADASRFEIGALMGEDPVSNQKRREAIHINGWTAELPEDVISINGLKGIRRFAQEGVSYSEDAGRTGMVIADALEQQFAARGINEKGGRVDAHLVQVARTVTALRGETETKPAHVVEAAEYMATAVIGMLVQKPASEITSAHEALKAAA